MIRPQQDRHPTTQRNPSHKPGPLNPWCCPYTGTTGNPAEIIAGANGCMDLPRTRISPTGCWPMASRPSTFRRSCPPGHGCSPRDRAADRRHQRPRGRAGRHPDGGAAPSGQRPPARPAAAAWREAGRVVRPGGVVVAATISRFASILDGLSRNLLALTEVHQCDPERSRIGSSQRSAKPSAHTADTPRPMCVRMQVAMNGTRR
jgi:hypothetical protein